MSVQLTPFLKWAGGKRWLAERFNAVFPTKINRYYEPFVGSAAVFFALGPSRAILSDLNAELIEAYTAIRDGHERVRHWLRHHQLNHSDDYYYRMRESRPRTVATRAARFIYLNRTCWNGLYRVNKQGLFNVPRGTKNNVLLDTDDFGRVAAILENVELRVSDFESVLESACQGDLIFADPPYTVRHNYNGFLKYNERIFSWDDQVRLRDSLVRARDRGSVIVATNAFHPSVLELYKTDFNVKPLKRNSVIAASASFRGSYEELLITSF